MWLGLGPKETNKALTPMGFGLICQLLRSSKLPIIIYIYILEKPLIIFNTTI